MEEVVSVSSSSRFRFRDHPRYLNVLNESESDSLSSDATAHHDQDDDELQSMAGKGIMHLCSELLELERVSYEDFHQNLFSNYSAFVSIFREVEGLKKELTNLKKHVSTHKRLVDGLSDGSDIDFLPKDSFKFIIEDHICLEPSTQSLFTAHSENVCEILDVLLSEKRVDEAIEVIESETSNLEDTQSRENLPPDVLTCYRSVLSEKRAKVVNQLKLVCENTRVTQPELLKNLIRLRRVGNSHLANHLLRQYYHTRIVTGIHKLKYVNSGNGTYIHDAAKLAFSMIYQATMAFLILNGEESSYFPDLEQWAYEETELFADCFSKYVESISDINGGMVTVLEALKSSLSYCSLLAKKGIVLNTCLVKHVRPCLEEFLQNHIDHFKVVIGIFTSADYWVVDRYLISGVFRNGCSFVVIDEQPEYCSLTSSAWKLVMVLQAITENVVPLLAVQLEGHVLRGLMDLYAKYVSLLEIALSCRLNNLDEVNPGINFAETLEQQVSILANVSSLSLLFSRIIRSSFNNITHLTFEANSIILSVNEFTDKLRGQVCQKFISKIVDGTQGTLISETWVGGESESEQLDEMMPSLVFQGLFLELRKLEKLAEENFVELDWLLEFKRELMVAVFISILKNEQLWEETVEELVVKHSGHLNQFILDIQFLVEIAKHGGHVCTNMVGTLLSHVEEVFISAGSDLQRATIYEDWAIKAAKRSLQKLQEMSEMESPLNDTIDNHEVEILDSYSGCASDMSPKLDVISPEGVVITERESFDDDNTSAKSDDNSSNPENQIPFDTTNTTEKIEHEKSLLEKLCLNDDGDILGPWSEEDETRSEHNVSELDNVETKGVKCISA